MEIVSVFIPPGEPEEQLFSLYAEGSLVRREGDADTGYTLEFDDRKLLAMFYHSQNHRRVYITAPPGAVAGWGVGSSSLHGVDSPRAVVAMLQGRGFDRFKRSFDLVKKLSDDCYSLPPLFWVRFAYLARYGRNSKDNIKRLLQLFGGTNGNL